MTTTNLTISVVFNVSSSNTLIDALGAIAKDGHCDPSDLVLGLVGVSPAMGSWGLDPTNPPLLLPDTIGKVAFSSPDSTDNKGNPSDHQTVCLVTVEVENEHLINGASGRFCECRLVVWHKEYACIVGLDNATTDPTLITVNDGSGSVAFNFSKSGAGSNTWQSDVLLNKMKSFPTCHLTSTTAFRSINAVSRGPYLRLIFYPHRNDLPFDGEQWLETLPQEARETFREKRHTCRLRLTKASLIEASFANWSAFDGSSARARAGLETCATPTFASHFDFDAHGSQSYRAGCPVPEPLRVIEPVRDPSAKGILDKATMVCWSVTYDLSMLTNHIPVLEFEGFNVDSTEPHPGSFSLLPDMFMLRDQTNGASGVAAVSDDKKFVGPVYMNYAVVRPFYHENNNYRCVRSVESFEKLHFRSPMGHRGLGKTYTDSVRTQKLRVQKFAENTIPSFCAAHKRGAGAVEFDVMLTSDQVPIVCHEPVFVVESISAGGHHMEQTEVFVHQATKRQLDAMGKEAVPAGSDQQYRLKTMVEHHWRSILEIAKSSRKKGNNSNNNALGSSNTPGSLGESSFLDDVAVEHVLRKRSALIPFGVTPTTARRERRRLNLIDQSPFIARTPSHRDKSIPLYLPTLAEVIENTPPTLSFNIEVKFPFQPKADRNLHLQSDNFEINRYCDLILEVVFKFVDQKREIGFSSFDPDICTALMMKQSRYHVLFLADCAERADQKDYRSWGLEAPIQYAMCERLAGVSIPSRSLLRPSDVETIIRNSVIVPKYKRDSREKQAAQRDDATLSSVDFSYPEGIVRVCNNRGLHVWTWGGANDNQEWCQMQRHRVGVSGVITDNLPPLPTEHET